MRFVCYTFIPIFRLSPTLCLLAPPHPKRFLIIIIPDSISIKIILIVISLNRSDSSFFSTSFIILKGTKNIRVFKAPLRPFQEAFSDLFDTHLWDIERPVYRVVRRTSTVLDIRLGLFGTKRCEYSTFAWAEWIFDTILTLVQDKDRNLPLWKLLLLR